MGFKEKIQSALIAPIKSSISMSKLKKACRESIPIVFGVVGMIMGVIGMVMGFLFVLFNTILYFAFDVVGQFLGFFGTTLIAYGLIGKLFIKLIMFSGFLNILPLMSKRAFKVKAKMTEFPAVLEIECGLVVLAFMISEGALDWLGIAKKKLDQIALGWRFRVVNRALQPLLYGFICFLSFPILLYGLFDIQLASTSPDAKFILFSNPWDTLSNLLFENWTSNLASCDLNLVQVGPLLFISLALPTSMIAQLYMKYKDRKLDVMSSFMLVESYWLPRCWRSTKSFEEIGFKQVYRFHQGLIEEFIELFFWRFIWNVIIGLFLNFELRMLNGLEILALSFLGWNFALCSSYVKKNILKIRMKKNPYWLTGKICLHLISLCLNLVGLLAILSSNIGDNGRCKGSYPIFSVQDYVAFSKIITFIVYSATTILIIAKWSGKTGREVEKQQKNGKLYIIQHLMEAGGGYHLPVQENPSRIDKEQKKEENCKQDDENDAV